MNRSYDPYCDEALLRLIEETSDIESDVDDEDADRTYQPSKEDYVESDSDFDLLKIILKPPTRSGVLNLPSPSEDAVNVSSPSISNLLNESDGSSALHDSPTNDEHEQDVAMICPPPMIPTPSDGQDASCHPSSTKPFYLQSGTNVDKN